MTPEEIRTEYLMGRLSRNQALVALALADESPAALGYVHVAPSPLLRLRGALVAAGHDVTRVDLRRTR